MGRLIKAGSEATLRLIQFSILAMGIASMYVVLMSMGIPSAGELGSRMQSRFFPALEDVKGQVVASDGTVVTVTYPAFRINSYRWDGDDLILDGQLCKVQPYEFVGSWWAYGKFEEVWTQAEMDMQNRGAGGRAAPRTRPTGCQYWSNWRLVGARNAPQAQFFGRLRYMPDHQHWMVYQTLGPFEIPPELPEPRDLLQKLPPDATDPILRRQ